VTSKPGATPKRDRTIDCYLFLIVVSKSFDRIVNMEIQTGAMSGCIPQDLFRNPMVAAVHKRMPVILQNTH
jgi:hypothetical protein